MPDMATYHRQHAEIGDVIDAISGKLDPAELLNGGAHAVCADINTLVGMISVHTASEDETLYPELIASSRPEASAMAERFRSEMGGLQTEIEMYFLKWCSPAAVSDNPGEFVNESKSLCDSLSSRIERENAELYPLAESL